jgi:hypothetical protein
MVTLKISPCTDVTLGCHPVQGGYGWGSPTPRRRSNCQTKKLKCGYGAPLGGPASRRTGRQTVGRNVTWNWTCAIALQITDPSSRQKGRPTWKINKEICHSNKCNIWSLAPKGVIRKDELADWPSVVMWLRLRFADFCKRQTRPLVREGAPQRRESNRQKETNIWSWEPEGTRHQDTLTNWSSVTTWLWPWLRGLFRKVIKPIHL